MATGDPQDRIPAYPGVERFVEAFDKLVIQQRRSRSRVPVVLLTEEGAGRAGRRIVGGLRSRLRGRSQVLAPHAYVPALPPGADPPPLELFEQIALQLAESMPVDTGQLRLPGYRLLHSVVTAPAIDGPIEHRHRDLRNHCYDEHRRWSRTANTLWRIGGRDHASGGSVVELLWNFVAGPLCQTLPRWLFGVRSSRRMLGRGRHRRWYAEWARLQRGTPPTDFFRSALDHVPGGEGSDPERLDRVLMHALLADLDGAVRRRRFNPWRMRRTTRFVLLFEEAGALDSRVQRFLRELRSAVEDLRCTSVIAIAAGARSLASRIPDIEAADLAHAGAELELVERQGMRAGQPTGIVVPVSEGPEDDERASYWLGRRPTLVAPSRRWGPRTEIAGAAVVVLVVLGLVAGGFYRPLWGGGDDSCAGQTFLGKDGQCVGVTTGKQRFAQGTNERQVSEVLEQIDRQNGEVDAAMGRRDEASPRYRTVVYIGPFSGGAGADDPVRGGTLPELRGIALAQAHVNALALTSDDRVPVRVLVANAGHLFEDAPAVADSIVQLARRDPSIVGAVGLGQSRGSTYSAIRKLDAAGIPMIGTSGTADSLLSQGPHYYQLAPVDSRAAQVMAAFVREAAMVTGPGQAPVKARRVMLIADPKDPYSSGLARSFRTEYRQGPVETLLLGTGGGATGPAGRSYDTMEDFAERVCRVAGGGEPTGVVWTARGSQFVTFLSEYSRMADDCPTVSVLGGDDVTNALLLGQNPWAIFQGLDLYYVSHGEPSRVRAESAQAYLRAYDAQYGHERGVLAQAMRLDGHSPLAWDALCYLSQAIDEAWVGSGKRDGRLDRALVQAVLYQGLGSGGFNGATGRIDAHGVAGGGRLTADKLVAILHGAPEGAPRPALLCGAVTATDIRKTWGPGKRYSCPVPVD